MATSCSTAQVHSATPTRSIPEAPKLQMPQYSRHAAVAQMVSTLEGFTVYSPFRFPPLLPFSSSHHPCPFLLLSPTPPLILSSPPPLPQNTMFEDPLRRLSEEEQEEMGLQYYDSDVHKASFTLPRFARKVTHGS